MTYLGIDQHARQITISLRDEYGDVVDLRIGCAVFVRQAMGTLKAPRTQKSPSDVPACSQALLGMTQ